MAVFKGGALRLFQTFLYALAFCCAAIILGIYSYFLAVLADRNRVIPQWERAVEGLSGVAVLYTIFAVILTCCLGGVSFFAFLGLVLDVLFIGAMIAIAVMTRHGANSCSGYVRTPLGDGQSGASTGGFGGDVTYSVNLRNACRLNTAAFAVSIVAAFIFLFTAIMQVALVRHHKKEKRYGPGPSNNYTSGYGGKFWQRKRSPKNVNDAELGTTGAVGTGAIDTRPSHEAGVAAPHAGYHTQPQGTGPYTTGTATNY